MELEEVLRKNEEAETRDETEISDETETYDLEDLARQAANLSSGLRDEIGKSLVGMDDLCNGLLICILAEGNAVLEGVQLVSRQLHSALANFGLAEIPAEGQPFDPNVHEAIAAIPSAEHDEGTIVHVERKGYAFHGRVLRPAQVVVAKAPQEAEAEQPTEEG